MAKGRKEWIKEEWIVLGIDWVPELVKRWNDLVYPVTKP